MIIMIIIMLIIIIMITIKITIIVIIIVIIYNNSDYLLFFWIRWGSSVICISLWNRPSGTV